MSMLDSAHRMRRFRMRPEVQTENVEVRHESAALLRGSSHVAQGDVDGNSSLLAAKSIKPKVRYRGLSTGPDALKPGAVPRGRT